MNFKKLTCIPLSILLMSASSSNFKQVESKIKHDYITCKNRKDEDDPFDFTFYGAFGVESSKKPNKITIDLKLDTYHDHIPHWILSNPMPQKASSYVHKWSHLETSQNPSTERFSSISMTSPFPPKDWSSSKGKMDAEKPLFSICFP